MSANPPAAALQKYKRREDPLAAKYKWSRTLWIEKKKKLLATICNDSEQIWPCMAATLPKE